MRTALLPLCLLLAACDDHGPGLPQPLPNGWSIGTPLPERLQELHGATLNGRIYVAGGFDSSNTASSRVYSFAEGQGWRAETPLPEARHHMPLAVVGDTLYAIGGYAAGSFNGTATLWAWWAAGNAWVPRAILPQPRGAHIAAVINGKILLAGGLELPTTPAESTDIYDAATGVWSRHEPIPTPRDHLGGGAINGRLYTAAGRLATILNTTEAYDPAADSWIPRAPMFAPRGGVGSAVLNGRLHVLGGEEDSSFATHYAYDPAGNAWQVMAPMPTARHGLAVAVLNGRLYTIGGGPVPGFSQTARVEIFQP